MELLFVPVSVLLVIEYKHIYHFVVEYRLSFSLFVCFVFFAKFIVYHKYVSHLNYIKHITINNWQLRAYVQLHVCI